MFAILFAMPYSQHKMHGEEMQSKIN